LTVVAVPLQVYLLTGSSLAVGLVGLAQLGPLLVCSLVGGAVVDAVDRRVLLVWVQLARGALGVGLVVNALRPAPMLWPLYALTAAAGLQAVDMPARSPRSPARRCRWSPAAWPAWPGSRCWPGASPRWTGP
jgi:hypothetical protein